MPRLARCERCLLLMIDLRHLRTLHALRETDSLPEAAERLHLTQSALSHQFRELETRVGMPVFVRKSKPVRFTTAGLKLLQLADQVLPLIRTTERNLSKLAGGTADRLHIAIECHSCYQWLMPSLDEFRCAWPDVGWTWHRGCRSRRCRPWSGATLTLW